MSLPQSRITAQGQISVPAEIRRKLGIGAGSVLEWDEQGGRVVVRKAARFSSKDIHDTLFERPPNRRSLHQLKQSIEQHMRRKHARR